MTRTSPTRSSEPWTPPSQGRMSRCDRSGVSDELSRSMSLRARLENWTRSSRSSGLRRDRSLRRAGSASAEPSVQDSRKPHPCRPFGRAANSLSALRIPWTNSGELARIQSSSASASIRDHCRDGSTPASDDRRALPAGHVPMTFARITCKFANNLQPARQRLLCHAFVRHANATNSHRCARRPTPTSRDVPITRNCTPSGDSRRRGLGDR